MEPSSHLQSLVRIARAAGREIMAVYATDFAIATKADNSPVTHADERAEAVILRELAAADPATPVISEEAAAKGIVPETSGRFYLVDPLDGTKEFLSRNGEFTVNIALIENGLAAAGVVYAPATGRLFAGEAGRGAAECRNGREWRSIAVRPCPPEGPDVVASRSHRDAATDAFIAAVGAAHIRPAGSSLKFCLVAAGEADLYPRYGRTMEWDTAAGHAVLAAAGGSVVTADGEPLTYGKRERGYDNPSFLALGHPSSPTVKHFAGNAR
jgi:3'(2'), 5'-bisphosphate nucleotidase